MPPGPNRPNLPPSRKPQPPIQKNPHNRAGEKPPKKVRAKVKSPEKAIRRKDRDRDKHKPPVPDRPKVKNQAIVRVRAKVRARARVRVRGKLKLRLRQVKARVVVRVRVKAKVKARRKLQRKRTRPGWPGARRMANQLKAMARVAPVQDAPVG